MLLQLADLFGMLRFMISSRDTSAPVSPTHRLVYKLKRKYFSSRIKLETDYDAALAYFILFLIISVIILSLYSFGHFVPALLYGELFILQIAIIMLLIDLLLWTRRSIKMVFKYLRERLEALSWLREGASSTSNTNERIKARLEKIESIVERISPSTMIPHFLLRALTGVFLLTLVYTVLYVTLSQLEPGSFVDGSGSLARSWETLAYYSIMITTGIGSDIAARTPLARFFVDIHGLATLYIFALLIALFTTVISEEAESERKLLLQELQNFRQNLS